MIRGRRGDVGVRERRTVSRITNHFKLMARDRNNTQTFDFDQLSFPPDPRNSKC